VGPEPGAEAVTVEVEGGRRIEVTKIAGLPADRFHLTDINLWGNNKTTDEGLANLAGLQRLIRFGNNAGGFSNIGVAYLGRLKSLRGLDLAGVARIDDAGLAHLEELPDLADLSLVETRITNAGVGRLALFPALTELDLALTAVSDTDRLADMTRLRRLSLRDTKVTAAGVRRLAGLQQLENLDVTGLPVDDKTLAPSGC
jgi:Leucine-rich repeat (LRR) protein